MNKFNKNTTILFCLMSSLLGVVSIITRILKEHKALAVPQNFFVFAGILLVLSSALLIIYCSAKHKNQYIIIASMVLLILKEFLVISDGMLSPILYIAITIMVLKPFNTKVMNVLIIFDGISKLVSVFDFCRDSYYLIPSILYWGATLCITVPLALTFFKKHDIGSETPTIKPIITCPYCKSSSCKRITTTAKVVNVLLFGLFGNKRRYQWHCNNCKSDF